MIVKVQNNQYNVAHPWCSGQLSRLPGKRPRDQFPPAPKRFMTYMSHLRKDIVSSLCCRLIFLYGLSRTYRVARLRAGPVGHISYNLYF